MKKSIAWEKYENFVNQNIAISKILMTGKLIGVKDSQENQDDDYHHIDYDEDEDDDEDDDGMILMQFPVTNELLNSIRLSANFNCWFGHTNFDITESVAKLLNSVDGIELLTIISRYRFIIGVGKAFNFSDVRININKALGIIDDKRNK